MVSDDRRPPAPASAFTPTTFCRGTCRLAGAHVYKLSAYCTPACTWRINLNLAVSHSRPELRRGRGGGPRQPTTTEMKWHQGIERTSPRYNWICIAGPTRRIKVIIFSREGDDGAIGGGGSVCVWRRQCLGVVDRTGNVIGRTPRWTNVTALSDVLEN